MDIQKLEEIKSLKLLHGSHKSLENGACIMELVSYVANEPWSDHPKCACPILTEYAIRLNDRFNDTHRQLLAPFIPLLLDTKSTDEIQIARKRLLMWRNVTATYPLLLDLFKLSDLAEELRAFGNTIEDMEKVKKLLIENKEKIYKNAYAAAYADAYVAAYADAYVAADAYADAYAYADADAYAYADAYAAAYADAYALRKKLVIIAIETFKLAIEIKE